uniref:GLTSCR protein conserved domain-containing protein n=1 Tax=Oryza glumipatula TaxID=40148 RepID=A0A0D9ZK24_9ORYZ
MSPPTSPLGPRLRCDLEPAAPRLRHLLRVHTCYFGLDPHRPHRRCRRRGGLRPHLFPLSGGAGAGGGFLHRAPPGSPRGMAVGTRLAVQQQQPTKTQQQRQRGIGCGGADAAGVAPPPSPRGMPMAPGPRLAIQPPSTILAPPTTTLQKQQGIGFGGAAAGVAPPPSPPGMPMVAGPRPARQRKRKQPNVAPLQQKIQGFGGAGAGAGPAPVSSSARAMAEKAAAVDPEEEARARERAAAEQIAYEDARKACNPDFTTPFASVEDAISRLLRYEEDVVYVEKLVLAFNVAVRKSGAGAARAEERLMVENLLLADEQRQSEHVSALVRQQQQQLVALHLMLA